MNEKNVCEVKITNEIEKLLKIVSYMHLKNSSNYSGIGNHDFCDACAVFLPAELRSHVGESGSICSEHVFPWKVHGQLKKWTFVKRGLEMNWRNDPRARQFKQFSSTHLKNSVDFNGTQTLEICDACAML